MRLLFAIGLLFLFSCSKSKPVVAKKVVAIQLYEGFSIAKANNLAELIRGFIKLIQFCYPKKNCPKLLL